MHELINIKNDEAVTTSLLVAEAFGKRHDNVIQAINRLLEFKESREMFHQGTYINSQNHKMPMFYMNRDGFSLLVMSFTGKKAIEWKFKYIEAFNQMEAYINFRKADKQIQKNSMQFLHDNLQMPSTKDYMKANTIANKCVSNMNGFPKMVKKADMSPSMLEQREPVLKDVCELMAVNDKYNLGVSIADNIYKKYSEVV